MDGTGDGGRDRIKLALSVGTGVLFVAGLAVVILTELFFGVTVFALGVILLAIRGYLGSGDKAVTGVLIFVAFAAVAIQAIEYFLAP